jgi:hypothetical protein
MITFFNFKQYRTATMLIQEIPAIIFQNDAVQATRMINRRDKLRNHDCYAPVVEYMSDSCLNLKVSLF